MPQENRDWFYLSAIAIGIVGVAALIIWRVAERALDLVARGQFPNPYDRFAVEQTQLMTAPWPMPEPRRPRSPQSRTVNLMPSAPVRVATAFPAGATRVDLRGVSPSGQSAILAMDRGNLQNVDVTNPVGDNLFVVPVGLPPQSMYLYPGDVLYGIGTDVNGVTLSATTSQAET